ncbi:alkaline phosphatase family protein [Chryseobacterium sp. POL2]|uniref:alkaline phosphatase PafA n=1 Tax=Chryseobacterium sp. POL2 TaxID=2713414 RepID=UPI0013E17909|nr:alkaline phosphatase PafA [Chryseobacterium sp. POL2]QIG88835.1 alkaline phosphatase family protein [Chryseobacterium sp. POL2]
MVKRLGIAAAIAFLGIFQVSAQTKLERPKLVVGLVIDQMRWDYLYRYYDKFQVDGFKRMLQQGYSFNNVMIPYLPTVTAIGHTSIYTGSVPSIHGIAGNDWTDKETGKSVYCTTDTAYKGVGTTSEKIGAHSPRNLWSTTITDQLGIATNFKSKVVGVSLKDRASILPAGHNPTGAFWFDETTGNFITSTYYMQDLPKWVDDFNAKNLAKELVSKGWNTLLPIEQYTESSRDDVPWESLLGSATKPVFPYNNLPADYDKKKGVLRTTPFGNTYTLKFAEASVDGYQLGADEITDFLAINIASTDYVGHAFGPNSIEVEDTYLRLDRDLAAFFKMLDKKVGKDNYLVFLSADHGGAHSVGYLQENKMPTGFFGEGLKKSINEELEKKFGAAGLVMEIDNYQVYTHDKLIAEKSLDLDDVKKAIISHLQKLPEILYAVDMTEIGEAPIPEPIKTRTINGYNWKRSGDIQMVTKDGYLAYYAKKGTTHSVWNSYDAHIPLIFMGWKVKNGESNKPYYMTDIAPTLAQFLKIENPSGNIGEPIVEVLGK